MKPKQDIRCAAHLTTMLTPRRAKYTARQVVKMIKERGLKFDAIACRGISGLLIAPIVAMRLNKTLIVIRKGEKTHSKYTVEGDHGAKNYLILDDFIDKGDTVKAITHCIFKANPSARCTGFIAYKQLSYEHAKCEDVNFEAEMKRAWWDHSTEEDIDMYFPSNYLAACKKDNL